MSAQLNSDRTWPPHAPVLRRIRTVPIEEQPALGPKDVFSDLDDPRDFPGLEEMLEALQIALRELAIVAS